MSKPIVLIGNGGHASVLTEILLLQKREIVGFTAPEKQKNLYDIPYLGTDHQIELYENRAVELVNGIGSVNIPTARSDIFNTFKSKGYTFSSVIHPSVILSPNAKIGEGVQLLAGTVIQPFVVIADNTIVNSSCSIDHHCNIGKHCHIAPGTTLSGSVQIGNLTHIGPGTTIINEISIGNNVLVGAGSLVLGSIGNNSRAFGVPAKKSSK